jgi:hypothetical protein
MTDSQLAANGLQRPPGYSQDFVTSLQTSAGSRVPRPDVSAFRYSQSAQDYPMFMRNLGEQQAQQAFQKNVSQGIQMGGGAQAYQKAMQQRNMERLGYMSQAGQAQMGVEQQMAGAHNTYQDLLAKLYGTDVSQRQDELGYLASLNRGGGSGGSFTVGGGSNRMGGTSTNPWQGGGYIGLGGRTSPAIGASSNYVQMGGNSSGWQY